MSFVLVAAALWLIGIPLAFWLAALVYPRRLRRHVSRSRERPVTLPTISRSPRRAPRPGL